jgi:hypothetical protein
MVWNRRFGLWVFVLLMLANIQTVGCAKATGIPADIDFRYESDPSHPRVGPNNFTVTLTNKTGERLAGAHVSLEGDMSHAGMSPVFGDARETERGRYQGTLDLDMPGDWTILFHIKLANGVAFDRQVDIRNIQAN